METDRGLVATQSLSNTQAFRQAMDFVVANETVFAFRLYFIQENSLLFLSREITACARSKRLAACGARVYVTKPSPQGVQQ